MRTATNHIRSTRRALAALVLAALCVLVGPPVAASAAAPSDAVPVAAVTNAVQQAPATSVAVVHRAVERTRDTVPAPVAQAPAQVTRQVTTTAATAPAAVGQAVAPAAKAVPASPVHAPSAPAAHASSLGRAQRAHGGSTSAGKPEDVRPAVRHRAAVTANHDRHVGGAPAPARAAAPVASASHTTVAPQHPSPEPTPPAAHSVTGGIAAASGAGMALFGAFLVGAAFALIPSRLRSRLSLRSAFPRSPVLLLSIERPG